MTLFEVDEAANRIREEVDNEANIVFGSTFDEAMEGLLRVSVVATGIEAEATTTPRSIPSGLSTLTPRVARPTVNVPEAPAEATPAVGMPNPEATTPPEPAALTAPVEEPEIEDDEPETLLLDEMEPETVVQKTVEAALELQPVPKRTVKGSAQGTISTPAPAEAEPAPVAELEEVQEEAQLMQPRRAPFIPPKPVVAEQAAEESEPEPFAAAAMENARGDTQKPQQESRRPSLFERMTGAGKPAQKEKPAAPAPKEAVSVAQPANASAAASTPAESPDPEERFQLSQAEEEMLDIPAFLRRQAN